MQIAMANEHAIKEAIGGEDDSSDYDDRDAAEQFEKLLHASRKFYIGQIQYEYDPNEPIFLRAAPTKETKYVQRCRTCKDDFKSKSEQTLCEFCGLGSCAKCTKKHRPFPKSALDSAGRHVERGVICKLCDTKFFIHQEVAINTIQIEA
jgi:hypothetical protein